MFSSIEKKYQVGLCFFPAAAASSVLRTAPHTFVRVSQTKAVSRFLSLCPALNLSHEYTVKGHKKEPASKCRVPLCLWPPEPVDFHVSIYSVLRYLSKKFSFISLNCLYRALPFLYALSYFLFLFGGTCLSLDFGLTDRLITSVH